MAKVSTYTEVTAASGDKIYVARSGTSRIVDANNFATAAQGALADSATQPADSVTTLNMSTAKILGRTTASSGAVEEISVGSGLTLSGGTLSNNGGAPVDATYIVQTANGTLTNEQALGALSTGILKNTTTTGVLSIAAAATDYVAPGAITTSGLTQATGKLLGRNTASTGAVEEITLGTGLSFSGTTLNATASGGGSLTLARWTALDGQPPASNWAQIDTRNSIAVLDFDASTDESIIFVGVVPEGATLTGGVAIYIHWMATSATSGAVIWEASIERSNTDLDSDSFDTVAFASGTANGTSGIITKTTITTTNIDSMVAGDLFRLKISRDANGTNGTDDMTGDAELVAVELRGVA